MDGGKLDGDRQDNARGSGVTVIVRKVNMPKPLKARIARGEYDSSLAAILFFMWKAGQITAYPLDPETYPDNDATEKTMTLELLKLKLITECAGIGFQSRMVKK